MYATGRSVARDDVTALMWLALAGDLEAFDVLSTRMTAEQIAEAQRRATEWTPTP